MNGCIVLLFHSVDPRKLLSVRDLGNIRPELFEERMKVLRSGFDIVTLREAIGYISGPKGGSDRLLAITFDDGPKSYAVHALPIMRAMGIPSTCFLITDCVGEGAVYWRYLYNFCLHGGFAKQLSDLLSAEYGRPAPREEIVSFTRTNFTKEKTGKVMGLIFERLFTEREYREREMELFLSLDDIERMKNDPLVSFGIHTASHPVMMRLTSYEIRDELTGSLAFYKKWIGDGVPALSVPFGRLGKDYDERTITEARKLGIEEIFSAYGGDNPKGQRLYNIRRIPVSEAMLMEGPQAFIKRLEALCEVRDYAGREKRLYHFMGS